MENHHSSMSGIHIFSNSTSITSLWSNSWGKIIRPVIEVRIVKIIDEHGKDIAIPSIFNPFETSYVVISSETERFVGELRDHKKEIRSSSDLLTAFHKSNGKEPCMEEGGSNRT